MLHSIIIKGNFAHKDATFEFAKGLTAITGRNGTGKSEILEMVRFALFGTAALRTDVADYKKTHVTLKFEVKGIGYAVVRTAKSANLFREGDLLATGIRPVNLKIVEIFGYGLDVFDTANNANQGSIEALSAMRPSDRKRLVDSTVGLTVLDDLAKWCREESASSTKTMKVLEDTLPVLVEPVKPDVTETEDELRASHDALMEMERERRQLTHILANPPPLVDEPSDAGTTVETVEDLELEIRYRNDIKLDLARLKISIAKLKPASTITQTEIDNAEATHVLLAAYEKAATIILETTVPRFTLTQLDVMEDEVHTWDKYSEWKHLSTKGKSQCPSCDHQWFHKAEDMAKLGDWGAEGKQVPPKPEINSLLIIQKLRLDVENFAAGFARYQAAQVIVEHGVPTPAHTKSALTVARHALAEADHRADLEHQAERLCEILTRLTDRSADLAMRLAYDRDIRAWKVASEVRAEWEGQEPTRRAALEILGNIPDQLASTLDNMIQVRTYNTLIKHHLVEVGRHATMVVKIDTARQEVASYQAAQLALAAIKARVKGHLVPSLSRVSSAILTQMTAGALSEVVVNEDFDITVDGVVIDGLSGAGKAASNLALRFGLGQVLTNRVFSVFMADEIDASMDEDRAQYIAECLRNLTTNISQIILVSHKTPDADNYITL